MNGDDDVWIIGSYDHANEITADVAKIARVATLISVYLHWI
jgi:Tfp pilus assembly protein PilO